MSKDDNNLIKHDGGEAEMPFLAHLEELRWRIIYSLIGVVVGAVVSWIFIDFLINNILLIPAEKSRITLQNLKPFGQLFLYVQVAIMSGIVLSIPNLFYQIWKFISPALEAHEKKYVNRIVVFSSVCFIAGIVFAYYIMLPVTLKFAGEFGTEAIENNFAITEYFTLIISVMLAAGCIFELPMLSFFLSKLGILTPAFMKKYRRHSIVAIMILAAILSPGADPIAQIFLAIPLTLLYEVSIFVSKSVQKKKLES